MDGGERKGYMTTKIECVQKLYPHFQYVQKNMEKYQGGKILEVLNYSTC